MDPAMGPDREWLRPWQMWVRGHRELRRVDMGEGVKAHWEAGTKGQYFHNDLRYGSGLHKTLVIKGSRHADWSFLRALVSRPGCIRKTITWGWSTSYSVYTSPPPPLSSPPPPYCRYWLMWIGMGGAQDDCMCRKENRGMGVTKCKKTGREMREGRRL